MTTEELEVRARSLMDRHGLTDWKIRFDRARRRAGCCLYAQKTLSFSVVLLPTYPLETVDDVILHEIAHALVGPHHAHGPVWKRMAARIGATPRALLAGDLPEPEAPWLGRCPNCSLTRGLFRVPRRVSACGACSSVFDPRFILEWTHLGVPTTPPGKYASELAALVK